MDPPRTKCHKWPKVSPAFWYVLAGGAEARPPGGLSPELPQACRGSQEKARLSRAVPYWETREESWTGCMGPGRVRETFYPRHI